MKKYGIFGASAHEAPALTMARSVLGVGRDAEHAAIRQAYRKLALRWHPSA